MLHLFVGIDTARAKTEARRRATGAETVVFGEGGESFERALEFLGTRGLFASAVVLIIDQPLETAEGRALIEEHAAFLQESSAEVFVVEASLTAEQKKLFPRGVTFEKFGGATEKAERPMPFGLSDAFMRGDRKAAWIEFRKLITAGASAEELHGTLSWAARSAIVAAKTKNAEEAGLKPFVYTKSKRFAEKLGIVRVEELSRALVRTYHQARMGNGSLELKLEQLILEQV